MLEIGSSTHAIAGFGKPSKPFRQAVAEIAECGYTHMLLLTSEAGPPVDGAGNSPEALVDLMKSDLDAVVRTVAAHGLRISSLYPGFGLDYSAEGMGKTVDHLKEYRDMAWRLGCHVMVHSAGAAQPRLPFDTKKAHIEQVAAVMDAVASDAPGEILKMAVDVHYGGIIETVADCEYLLSCARKRNAGLCLNMGHMTTSGEEGWTLLVRFPERIHVLAWKDHLVGDDLPHPVVSIELGKGVTPFQKYVDACRKVKCDAAHLITLEDVPFEEKKAALKRSLQFLTRLFEG